MESNWYEIMMTKVSEVNRRLGGDGFGFFQIANKGGRWRLNCSSECFLEEWEVLRLVDIIEYLFVQDSRSMNTNAFRFFVEDILIKWKNIKEEDKFRYEDVGGVKQKALIFGGWQMTGFDCWIKGDILFEGVYEAYYMVYGGKAVGNMKAESRIGGKIMGPITIKAEAGKTIDERLGRGIKEPITRKEEEELGKVMEVLKETSCGFKGEVCEDSWTETRVDTDKKDYKVEIRWRGDEDKMVVAEACVFRDKEGKEIDLLSNKGMMMYSQWLIGRVNDISETVYGKKKEKRERVVITEKLKRELEEQFGKLSDDDLIEMVGEMKEWLIERERVVGRVGEGVPQQTEEEIVLVTISRLNESIKRALEEEKKIRAKVVGELNDKINRDREKMGKIDETIGNIFRLIEKARALTDNVEKVFRGSINAVSTDLVKLNDRVTRNRDEIFSIVGNERGQKDKAIGALEDKVKRLEEAFSILRLAVEGRQGEAMDNLYSNILNSKKE